MLGGAAIGPGSPPQGAALTLPGMDGSAGEKAIGEPAIDLTNSVFAPFTETFDWAVPGLVLSVPGLLLVVVAVGIQVVGAMAWLPVVRRWIGVFGLGSRRRSRQKPA
jgi:hypothetical protein